MNTTITITMRGFVVSVLVPRAFGCALRGPEKREVISYPDISRICYGRWKRTIGSVKVKIDLVREDTGLGGDSPL